MFQLDCAIHVPNLPFKFPKKLGIKKEKVQHFFSFFPKMQKAAKSESEKWRQPLWNSNEIMLEKWCDTLDNSTAFMLVIFSGKPELSVFHVNGILDILVSLIIIQLSPPERKSQIPAVLQHLFKIYIKKPWYAVL